MWIWRFGAERIQYGACRPLGLGPGIPRAKPGSHQMFQHCHTKYEANRFRPKTETPRHMTWWTLPKDNIRGLGRPRMLWCRTLMSRQID